MSFRGPFSFAQFLFFASGEGNCQLTIPRKAIAFQCVAPFEGLSDKASGLLLNSSISAGRRR